MTDSTAPTPATDAEESGARARGFPDYLRLSRMTKLARDFEAQLAALRASQPVAEGEGDMKAMVDRFLGWKLPADFAPDAGISFEPDQNPVCWPVGTNLFTATQAEAMIRHLLGPTPAPEGWTLPPEVESAADWFEETTLWELGHNGTLDRDAVMRIRDMGKRLAAYIRSGASLRAADLGRGRAKTGWTDEELLEALAENSWDLRSISAPTGGDDYDVNWQVIEHHQAAPHERVIAHIFEDDPRAAIIEAINETHKAPSAPQLKGGE